MIKKIFAVLTVLLLGSFVTKGAGATEITFDFTATVTLSQNTSILTGGSIPVPSVVTGSYTFDSNAVDQFPGVLTGEYVYTTPPNGMIVHAGSNVFQSDPNNVNFLIFAEDGSSLGGGVPDTYDAQSNNNVWPLSAGTPQPLPFESILTIQMVDTVNFIFGEALPLVPPQPTLPPVLRMFATSPDNSFPIIKVEATVESLTLRPPPTVESTTQDLKNFVAGLPTSSFQNSNMMSTLLNKIDALKGNGDGIKNKLINDILAKGDGCGSAPDSNDWIKSCAAQQQFQAAVQAILDLL